MVLQKVAECSKALAENNKTIAFVESASAGRMSYEFSLAEQSGEILIGGIVTYDAKFKESMLGVSHDLIEKYTAESAEVTQSMATLFYKNSKADICVALTGLAAPGGQRNSRETRGDDIHSHRFPRQAIGAKICF